VGRGGSPILEAMDSPRLQIVRADLRSGVDIDRALDGIDTVYHLATTSAKTWPEFQEQEIEPTRALAEACLTKGIKRFIYTGTIDSYYAGKGAGTITEDTPLDPKIQRRNRYARAKAAVESLLTDLHRTRGLPLIIVRPGIVIGQGGNPFHWGVGRWASEGVCEVWGDGENPLPFVLVDDVAAGLVLALDKPGIEGSSFNLIDLPLLSARDYVAQVQSKTGMRIDATYKAIWRFYVDDMSKWPLKVAVRHPDATRKPSYHDWESRTQKALFDCSYTREKLGWMPASTRERLIEEGIGGSLAAWLDARS
jgi:nucleoside-diphosphate-sugar epimerase